jgi:hypothetical protein
MVKAVNLHVIRNTVASLFMDYCSARATVVLNNRKIFMNILGNLNNLRNVERESRSSNSPLTMEIFRMTKRTVKEP